MQQNSAVRTGLLVALIILPVVSGAQDRLKTLPGFDQFTKMAPLYQGTIKSGSVIGGGGRGGRGGGGISGQTVAWSADGRSVEYSFDGKRYRFDLASKKSAEVPAGDATPPVPAGPVWVSRWPSGQSKRTQGTSESRMARMAGRRSL